MGHAVFEFCAGGAAELAQDCVLACTNRRNRLRSVGAVPGDPRPQLGRLGEQLAAEHLVRRGFQIVERNYRTRWGELDIIAFDGCTLAFCEVKTRRASRSGAGPLEAIRTLKRSRVRTMARTWLAERNDRPYADAVRFDAIGVTLDAGGRLLSLEHLEGAF